MCSLRDGPASVRVPPAWSAGFMVPKAPVEISSAATCKYPWTLQILLGPVPWQGKQPIAAPLLPFTSCPPPSVKGPKSKSARRCSEKYPQPVGREQCSFKDKEKMDPQALFTSPPFRAPPSGQEVVEITLRSISCSRTWAGGAGI